MPGGASGPPAFGMKSRALVLNSGAPHGSGTRHPFHWFGRARCL